MGSSLTTQLNLAAGCSTSTLTATSLMFVSGCTGSSSSTSGCCSSSASSSLTVIGNSFCEDIGPVKGDRNSSAGRGAAAEEEVVEVVEVIEVVEVVEVVEEEVVVGCSSSSLNSGGKEGTRKISCVTEASSNSTSIALETASFVTTSSSGSVHPTGSCKPVASGWPLRRSTEFESITSITSNSEGSLSFSSGLVFTLGLASAAFDSGTDASAAGRQGTRWLLVSSASMCSSSV